MSQLNPPLMTPAGLAADRRNSLKSTSLRPARGKAQLPMNSVRDGWSSPGLRNLWRSLLERPPGADVDGSARAALTLEQAADRRFSELVEVR